MLSVTYAECHYADCHICCVSQVNAICRVSHILSILSVVYTEISICIASRMLSDIMPIVTLVMSSHVCKGEGAYPRVGHLKSVSL